MSFLRLFEGPNLLAFEGFDVKDDVISSRNGFEIICRETCIDGRRIGERVAVLPMMKADVGCIPTHFVHSIAPILCAPLRERCELHVNIST